MKRIALAIAVIISMSASLLSSPSPADAHLVSCTASSGDQKLSSSLYIYTAISQCNGTADTVSVVVWLQAFNWNTYQWYDLYSYPVGNDIHSPGSLAVVNQSLSVPPFGGINCRRIRSRHYMFHGNPWTLNTTSPGKCF